MNDSAPARNGSAVIAGCLLLCLGLIETVRFFSAPLVFFGFIPDFNLVVNRALFPGWNTAHLSHPLFVMPVALTFAALESAAALALFRKRRVGFWLGMTVSLVGIAAALGTLIVDVPLLPLYAFAILFLLVGYFRGEPSFPPNVALMIGGSILLVYGIVEMVQTLATAAIALNVVPNAGVLFGENFFRGWDLRFYSTPALNLPVVVAHAVLRFSAGLLLMKKRKAGIWLGMIVSMESVLAVFTLLQASAFILPFQIFIFLFILYGYFKSPRQTVT